MSGGGASDGAKSWDADEGCSMVRCRLELEKTLKIHRSSRQHG